MVNNHDIKYALSTIGPMTAYELSLQLHVPMREIQAILKRMKEAKQIFTPHYEREQPVYAIGQGRNAKPPKANTGVDYTFNARLAAGRHPELGIWSRLVA